MAKQQCATCKGSGLGPIDPEQSKQPRCETCRGKGYTARQYTDADRARWQAGFDSLLEQSLPESEAKALAASVYNGGRSKQVSRKSRMVATLPEGETAIEALKRCSPSQYKRVMAIAESWALDAYSTYCATNDGHMHTLDMRTFAEFKKLETGQEFKFREADLRNVEDLFGLSDPERERRLRNALLELDQQRKDAQ